MIRVFVVVAAFFSFHAVATDLSLEAAWTAQEQKTISPVRMGDSSFRPSPSNAGRICDSLGYKRVVMVETEFCVVGEKLLMFRTDAPAAYLIPEQPCVAEMLKIKSLTCAR